MPLGQLPLLKFSVGLDGLPAAYLDGIDDPPLDGPDYDEAGCILDDCNLFRGK